MDPMCTCLWNVFFFKFIIYVSLICFQAKALEFIDNNKVSLWQVCDILLEQLCTPWAAVYPLGSCTLALAAVYPLDSSLDSCVPLPWTAVYPLGSCVPLGQLLACTSNGADVC